MNHVRRSYLPSSIHRCTVSPSSNYGRPRPQAYGFAQPALSTAPVVHASSVSPPVSVAAPSMAAAA